MPTDGSMDRIPSLAAPTADQALCLFVPRELRAGFVETAPLPEILAVVGGMLRAAGRPRLSIPA
jgi:hypothetical protein